MAEMFWDRARVDPYAPPIFAAPPPPPLSLSALPQGHPWWMPPMFPPADAAAGPVAPASVPLPPLANIYPWGNAPLIFHLRRPMRQASPPLRCRRCRARWRRSPPHRKP